MPLCIDALDDVSVPIDESDKTVQESAPFARMGMVDALLELLLPIWDRFLWNLKQSSPTMAKIAPITTPIEIPMIRPDDFAFISLMFPTQATNSSTKGKSICYKSRFQLWPNSLLLETRFWIFPILESQMRFCTFWSKLTIIQ